MRGVKIKSIFLIFVLIGILAPFVSAGVGISWDKESTLVPENTKTCLTYKVYNPWPKDSYVQITLSDELKQIITSYESEPKFVPKETSSREALPVDFCFKTPSVYTKDCLIGDVLICKQECTEEMKVYSGEVQVMELSETEFKAGGGSGGSRTQMSVSAPLKVRVQCVPHSRDYSVVYLLVALIAGTLLVISILKQRKKQKTKSKKSK